MIQDFCIFDFRTVLGAEELGLNIRNFTENMHTLLILYATVKELNISLPWLLAVYVYSCSLGKNIADLADNAKEQIFLIGVL